MISTVFMCAGRLSLTKMILLRYMDMMEYDNELCLVYDGNSPSYVSELEKICDFKHKVINWNGETQGHLLNVAHDKLNSPYYMFMENDWWWREKGCIEEAMYAIDKYEDVHIVRIVDLPYKKGDRMTRQLPNCKMGDIDPAHNMAFHFNPQIRTVKYPAGRFLPTSNQTWPDLESAMFLKYGGFGSWVLLHPYFRHIGFFSSNGQPFMNNVYTLEDIYSANFYGGTFSDLKLTKEYRELFNEYLLWGLDKIDEKKPRRRT